MIYHAIQSWEEKVMTGGSQSDDKLIFYVSGWPWSRTGGKDCLVSWYACGGELDTKRR